MDQHHYPPSVEDILTGFDASHWIKNALQSALRRDPVDAAHDARVLSDVLKANVEAILKEHRGNESQGVIPLTTLEDILGAQSDADFEQILAELPDILRAFRKAAQRDGHDGFVWPVRWRRDGGPSTLTAHCTDGSVTIPLDSQAS